MIFRITAAALALGFALPASAQTSGAVSFVAKAFAHSLQESRDNARKDAKPIPPEIRKQLEGYFPAELLDKTRFKIGDDTPAGLAGFAIRNGNAAAVTLYDTVVFKKDIYAENIGLWAHEMHHVKQYSEWGLEGFAAKYAFGWQDVEAEAEKAAADFMAWKAKH